MTFTTFNSSYSGDYHRKSARERALEIKYLPKLKIIYIRGWSVLQNVEEAYEGLFKMIEDHLDSHDDLCIFFRYNLFNCTTAKYVLSIIKLLNEYKEQGKVIEIYWSCVYSPEEMVEIGEDFKQFSRFDFFINKN